MDYRLYHAVNSFVAGHSWLGHVASGFETAAVPVLAVATFGLWFAARPGGARRWKLACGSALGSGALALIVNQLVAKVWDRARPFATHPSAHVWGARSHDPSFPSDHASAAFGIAFAVLFFSRVAGALFIAAATLIAVGRVVVGAHYPADVAAGLLVGLASAVVVVKLARPLIAWLVRLVERVTDPIVAPVWRALR